MNSALSRLWVQLQYDAAAAAAAAFTVAFTEGYIGRRHRIDRSYSLGRAQFDTDVPYH